MRGGIRIRRTHEVCRAHVLAAGHLCEPGKPLTFRGVNVYRVTASGTFDLPSWRGTGGLACSLDVIHGVVTSSRGELY